MTVRRWLVALLVVAVVAGGAVFAVSRRTTDPPRSCTPGVKAGSPPAGTPEGAMDAWWQRSGPEDAVRQADLLGEGRPPAPLQQDFVARTPFEYEWRYRPDRSVVVTVTAAATNLYVVTSVSGCRYAGPT